MNSITIKLTRKPLNNAQARIIKEIAEDQVTVFLDLMREDQLQIQEELYEDGYDTAAHEIEETINNKVAEFMHLSKYPTYFSMMRAPERSIIYDALITDYNEENKNVSGLLTKLNILQSIDDLTYMS